MNKNSAYAVQFLNQMKKSRNPDLSSWIRFDGIKPKIRYVLHTASKNVHTVD